MGYKSLDTKRLQKLAQDLRYDSQHKLEEQKRVQAKIELAKVEAELKNRQGIQGLVRLIKNLLGSR
jgi:hypothetical protein